MSTEETKAVLERHLKAIFENPSAVMDDYADDAVFISQDGVFKGKAAIGEYIAKVMGAFPAEMFSEFKMDAQQVDGDIAYIAWSAGKFCPLGTDTFVIRNGKIVSQTIAFYAPS